MHAFDPQWTVGGPLDDFSTVDMKAKEKRILEQFESNREDVRSYFKGFRELVKEYPNSPSLLVRLAIGHINLNDFDGALELFEKAHAFLDNDIKDPVFNRYLQVLRDFIKRNREEEDREWSQPEGSFILSPYVPPKLLPACSFSANFDDNLRTAWSDLLSEDRKDVVVERYSRLLAVESSEIERVFLLGGDSLAKIVRGGFYPWAIDSVLMGDMDPITVVSILKDFAHGLETFTGIIKTCPEVKLEHICHLHALLMQTTEISTITLEGEKFNYLVPPGIYRRRLVTTSVAGVDGVVQFAKWQDIPGEMAWFASHLKDCLSSTVSPFVKAAWIHTIFVGIHPFVDGNGRVARIIASIPLIKAGLPFINVRLEMREEYMKAVQIANSKFDLQPLADIFVKSMESSIKYIASFPPPHIMTDDGSNILQVGETQ